MRLLVVCAPGIGDALIMHIASHHLAQAGFDVITDTSHNFGRWLEDYQFGNTDADAVFLQHDNSEKAKQIHGLNKPIYTFYGSHKESKHGPLREGFDYVCDPNLTMVANVAASLKSLFQINASFDNGMRAPANLTHRKYRNRVAIHPSSSSESKNWPLEKYQKVANWLKLRGYEPVFIPKLPSIDDLCSFIYESGYFIGNDSGPGHIASILNIPHLIVGPSKKQMLLWRPGWARGEIALPPSWAPKKYWKQLTTTIKVIKALKNKVLQN